MGKKGTTEDEMVGWHHRLDGHEFEQARGVGDGQGGLVYCSPWGHKESDTPETEMTLKSRFSFLLLYTRRENFQISLNLFNILIIFFFFHFQLQIHVHLGFTDSSVGKEPTCNAEDTGNRSSLALYLGQEDLLEG